MVVDDKAFKDALKLWASGVTIVTAQTEKLGLKGMTATSFSSVSVEPPQIQVCINQKTGTGAAVLEGKAFAVNILTAQQQQLSDQFASELSQQQRFAGIKWHPGTTGSPIIDDALVSIECMVAQQIQAGTHWVIIGKVQNVVVGSGEPLLYYRTAYRELLPA